MAMRTITITIDDDAVAQAAEILGTTAITETVNEALHAVVMHEARRQFVEQLRTMDALDLNDPDVMSGAWAE